MKPRRRTAARALAALLLMAGVLGGSGLWWLGEARHGPIDAERYMAVNPSAEMLGRDGAPLYAYLNEGDHWSFPRDLDAVSHHLLNAAVAAEDRRFRRHAGVDPRAVVRAAAQNVWRGGVASGASTLTMQVVKLHGDAPLTFGDKARQAIKALRLETRLTKDDILWAYVNSAPYGRNLTGVEAASRRYFGKSASQLTLSEAALLAGLPKAPGRLDPIAAPHEALNRRGYVLGQMLAAGFIDEGAYRRAMAAPLGVRWHPHPAHAPHLAMMLRDEARERGAVTTTLDRRLQGRAETLARVHAARQGPGVTNAAVIVIDVAAGEILARVGSQDFFDTPGGGQVDLCRAPRSPGSALKPFTFAVAMEENLLYPSEILMDGVLDYGQYRPINFDGRYRGALTAELALRQSLNVPSVAILERVGYASVQEKLQALDLTTLTLPASAYGLGLTLGNAETRLDELAAAYGVLAALGEQRPLRVVQGDGGPAPVERRFSPGVARAIYNMLEQPLPGELRDQRLTSVSSGRRVAWKTGTSTGLRDAWAFVFNQHYVVGVWMGNNDGSPSANLVGGEAALPLAAAVFRELPARSGRSWPPESPYLRAVEVCARSGLPAGQWCGATRTAKIPREQYLNRRCGVHGPAGAAPILARATVTAADTERAASERWPGSARRWNLADIAVPRGAAAGRRTALEITNPPGGAVFVLTGEPGGDRIRLRASRDGEEELHWYLNGRYKGRSARGEPLYLSLEAGEHALTCMTSSGETDTVEFEVARN